MTVYKIAERRAKISGKSNIIVGCTAGSNNRQVRNEFQTREEAVSFLRSDDYYRNSIIEYNLLTEPDYEVIEFFVEKEELGEDGYPILVDDENGEIINITERDRQIIAVSDMPEEAERFGW